MFNMNMFFEFVAMVLKNHTFKVNFSRNVQVEFVYFISCPNKQSRLQVDVRLIFSTYLISNLLMHFQLSRY